MSDKSVEKKSANQIVDDVYVRTNRTVVDQNLASTDGIREAIQANSLAIRRLADYVDGVTTDETGIRIGKDGKPVG